jgi:hypothetical protein
MMTKIDRVYVNRIKCKRMVVLRIELIERLASGRFDAARQPPDARQSQDNHAAGHSG